MCQVKGINYGEQVTRAVCPKMLDTADLMSLYKLFPSLRSSFGIYMTLCVIDQEDYSSTRRKAVQQFCSLNALRPPQVQAGIGHKVRCLQG